MKTIRRLFISTAAALWLAACTTTVPKEIRDPAVEGPALAEVRDDPQRHAGATVRWGGEVIAVQNEAQITWVEVLARPLRTSGEPADALSDGRFLARVSAFVDPAEYQEGRALTVSGTLAGSERRPVGGFDYLYPVVEVQVLHLWPPELFTSYPGYSDPFWYDPWWPWWHRPYYPYWGGYYPWRPPHHHHDHDKPRPPPRPIHPRPNYPPREKGK
jgi:outer membrane lipoprotein